MHRGESRQIQRGQRIHESVFKLIRDKKYVPRARFYDTTLNWSNLERLRGQLMEEDPYTNAVRLIEELEKPEDIQNERMDVLMNLFATGNRQRTIL